MKGLKGFLTGFSSKVPSEGLGPFSGEGVDEGERSCGSLGHSNNSCSSCRLGILGIYVLKHAHDYIQVVTSIQGTMQLCGHSGF